jgi:hypothetical protein
MGEWNADDAERGDERRFNFGCRMWDVGCWIGTRMTRKGRMNADLISDVGCGMANWNADDAERRDGRRFNFGCWMWDVGLERG